MSPTSAHIRAVRQRINEGSPLDSVAQELAAQQVMIDDLALQLRTLRAQRMLRDVLLPQAQVSYRGATVARIDAGMPLEARRGLHGLEYDSQSRPFRWTGPEPVFFFDLHLERLAPLRFQLQLAEGLGEQSTKIRAFCDGAELPLQTQHLPGAVEYSAVLFPRETLGLTRLSFMPVTMFQPRGPDGHPTDTRMLGVVFRELIVAPTSTEDATAYLHDCDDLARLVPSAPAGAPATPAADPPAVPALVRPKHKRGGGR